MKIEDRYRFIVDNAKNAVLLFENGVVSLASKEFCELSGLSLEKVLGSRVYVLLELVDEEDKKHMRSVVLREMRSKLWNISEVFRLRSSTDSERWIECTTKSVFDEDHETYVVIAEFKDVTKTKIKGRIIREKLEFEKVISQITSTLLSDHPQAVDDVLGSVLEVSKACRIYIFENFIDEVDDLCMRQIHEKCSEGVIHQINNPVLQKISYKLDGFARWAEYLSKDEMILGDIKDFPENEREILESQGITSILILPLWANGKWFGFIGFDYTKEFQTWSETDLSLLQITSKLLGTYFQNKRNHEIIRRQNDNLIQLNSDKDRFMQILAHDLKNPFNSLINITDILVQKIDAFDKDRIKTIAGSLHQVSVNTYNLLSDLLLWSGTRAGQVSFDRRRVVFDQVGEDILEELQFFADKKDISLMKYPSPDVILNVDVNMLKTILRNLLSNAIKFTNQGGLVTLYTEDNESPNITTIVVADNGVGIPQDAIGKLWSTKEPFTTKGTDNEKGTGMGLLLCKEFVERHRGHIWVESKLGKGSSFKFTMQNWRDHP